MQLLKNVVVCILIITLFTFTGTAFSASSNIQSFYEGSKVEKNIVVVGDSTSDPADGFYDELEKATAVGGALEGATIVHRGTTANTLQDFIADKSFRGFGIKKIIEDKPNLIIFSYGINDIRGGAASPGRNGEQIKQDLKTAIDTLLKETNSNILLRIPNTFLTSNPTNNNYLIMENSQLFSSALRDVYESFKGYNSRVDVIDIPSMIFGQKALPTHPLMEDNLHPNDEGYRAIANAVIDRITGKTHDEQIKYQLKTDQSNVLLQECRTNYMNSKTQTERDKWHKMADVIRGIN
jgi:lysophospholipase L1-like esterase